MTGAAVDRGGGEQHRAESTVQRGFQSLRHAFGAERRVVMQHALGRRAMIARGRDRLCRQHRCEHTGQPQHGGDDDGANRGRSHLQF